MAASVRMFVYPGVVPVLVGARIEGGAGPLYVLKQPYVASAALSVDGTPVSASPSPPAAGNPCVLHIEIQKGNVVHYEVAGPNQAAPVATVNSPTLEGKDKLDWGFGYVISLLLAGSEA